MGEKWLSMKVLKKDLLDLRLELEQLSIESYLVTMSLASVYHRIKKIENRLAYLSGPHKRIAVGAYPDREPYGKAQD